MIVFVVCDRESGIFDSVWSTRELAEEHASEFDKIHEYMIDYGFLYVGTR